MAAPNPKNHPQVEKVNVIKMPSQQVDELEAIAELEKEMAEFHQRNTIVLDPEDWNKVMEIFNAPVEINENLKRGFEDFEKFFGNRST